MSKRDPNRRGRTPQAQHEKTRLTGRAGKGPVGDAGRRPFGWKPNVGGYGQGDKGRPPKGGR